MAAEPPGRGGFGASLLPALSGLHSSQLHAPDGCLGAGGGGNLVIKSLLLLWQPGVIVV